MSESMGCSECGIPHSSTEDCNTARLRTILSKMEKIEEMTVTVIEQVKPAIDDLMNSSLGKMLGIKKGK